jgi:predicted O-linked N-acetylglucosamine transferase (SPINDLY family)
MSQDDFLSALEKITAGTLTLSDLLNTASGLAGDGQTTLAQRLYKIWIGFNREHPQAYVAHFNCACLESEAGDLDAARGTLAAVIELNPDFLPAYINLGGLLERAGEVEAGLDLWRSGLARLTPVVRTAIDYKLAAFKQLARVLAEQHNLVGAEAVLQDALILDPTQRDVMEQFIALRLGQCKWPTVAPWEGCDRRTIMSGVHPLSMAAYTDDPLLQLALASQYVELSIDAKLAPPQSDRRHAPIDLNGRRLRVGYVSSDLRDHAVGYLMAELFEIHDRSQVEVFAYYCGPPSTGELTQRTQAAVEHWVDIAAMTEEAAAARIAADGIDILVDVNGHTREMRTGVFARRPAPIQVNWLGFPGTMGSPYHHYIIADDWIAPPGSEAYYSEKVVRLPCYQPNDRKRVVAEQRPTRQDAGLPDDAFVFCCFNGAQKITRFTFERWMEILKRTPNSVLWLLESNEDIHNRLREAAERYGVSAARLIIAPKQRNAHHLARYPLADLFLDTAPYGAHTTASDSLWMGVPVLTLSGRAFASRVCGSLVRAAGLSDLICATPDEFVDRAVALADNPAEIAAYKAKLEADRYTCDLFNMEKLTGSLEDLYRGMCEDYWQGQLPRPDLAGLEAYLRVGAEHDHEAQEMLGLADYDGFYRSRLAARHRVRPIAPDNRLWPADEIARADADPLAADPTPFRLLRAAGE